MPRVNVRLASGFALVLGLVLLAGCSDATTSEQGDTTPASPAAEDVVTPAGDTAVELPPTPEDVSGMQTWLSEAYPGAAWLTRVKKIEYVSGEVPESGGFSNAIVVTTDLDFESEQTLADEITAALGEAHPVWAAQFVIRYVDGNNITAGDIVDRTP